MQPLKSYRAQKFEEEELTNRSKIELQLSTRSEKQGMRNSSLKANQGMMKNNSTAQIRESMVDHNYSLSGQPTNKLTNSQVMNNQSNGYKSSTKIQDWSQPDSTPYMHQQTATFQTSNPITSHKSNIIEKKDDPPAYKNRIIDPPPQTSAVDTIRHQSVNKLALVHEDNDEHDRYQSIDNRDVSNDDNDFDDYDDANNDGYLPSSMINKPTSSPNQAKGPKVSKMDDDDWGDF